MKVCWQPVDEGDEGIGRALHGAFGKRLEGAGYQLVKHRCDFQMSWSFRTKTEQRVSRFENVRVVLRNNEGEVLDILNMQFASDDAPTDEPDRVAIAVVNGINASNRLAAYAQTRSRSEAAAAASPSRDEGTERPRSNP